MRQKEIGIYVHIPFCKEKCEYCDFYSVTKKESWANRYVQALLTEIKEKSYETCFPPIIETIYIGGGTPSFIDSSFIIQLLNGIRENFEVKENVEITIEVNPGAVTIEKLEDYIKAGINRLSIGLQATQNHLLQAIGRIHNYYDFIDTYRLATEVGFENINIDLMIGLPNQTLMDVINCLEEVISLEPEHISVYSLILEKGTLLEKKVKKGLVTLPEEELERQMYWKVKEILEENKYVHYEISNFSKISYESKHNLDCWKQKEYMGFGAGAHSYYKGIRYSNIANIEKYVENIEMGMLEKNIEIQEKQDQKTKQKEYMLLGLRKLDGVSIQEFKNKFVSNPIYLYNTELEKLVQEELIEIDGDIIKLSKKGLDFANLVWQEFI